MKKKEVLIFTKILYVLFLIGTIISIFIVYRDIDSSISFRFLTGYLFFTFIMLLYVPFITVLNSRKFKRSEISKRMLKFIVLFILFAVSNYGINYYLRPSNINFYRILSTALGLSFGISFIDFTFLRIKKN